MAILIIFLLGVGNFALHRAVMDSGHPLVGRMPWFVHALNGRLTLAIEFLLLLAALLLWRWPPALEEQQLRRGAFTLLTLSGLAIVVRAAPAIF